MTVSARTWHRMPKNRTVRQRITSRFRRLRIIWGGRGGVRSDALRAPSYRNTAGVRLQPRTSVEKIVSLALEQLAIGVENDVGEGMGPVLVKEMEVAALIELHFRPAEREHHANRNCPEHLDPIKVRDAQIQPELAEIVGLLQNVFAKLGHRVGGFGRGRDAKFLLPDARAFNHIKFFWRADNLLVPLFDLNGSDDRVTP